MKGRHFSHMSSNFRPPLKKNAVVFMDNLRLTGSKVCTKRSSWSAQRSVIFPPAPRS
jgi:hypothetical protein